MDFNSAGDLAVAICLIVAVFCTLAAAALGGLLTYFIFC